MKYSRRTRYIKVVDIFKNWNVALCLSDGGITGKQNKMILSDIITGKYYKYNDY